MSKQGVKLLFLCLLFDLLSSFSIPFVHVSLGKINHVSGRTITTVMFATSREEEIAALEAQLRKLREEEDAKEIQDDSIKDIKVEEAVVSRKLEKMKGKVMLLSETDILGESGSENDASVRGSLNLASVLGVVLGVVLLIAFAQVPVGQEDLQRYSASGSRNVQTIDLGDLNPDRKASTDL
jgi:hypothetical protein